MTLQNQLSFATMSQVEHLQQGEMLSGAQPSKSIGNVPKPGGDGQ